MFKKFGLWLLAASFTFSVIVVAVSAATNSVFGSSEALKQTLTGSEVYDSAADTIVDQAVESMRKPPEGEPRRQGGDDLQLDPKLVEKIATRVVTPDKLQVYAEQIVDGIYNWLEGEVEQPNYNIDVSAIKKDLGDAVGDAAVERVEGLPACTPQQLMKLQAQAAEFDPFNIPCRPPGVNLKAERTKLVKEITKSKELLEDTKVTAEDTKSEDSQKTPFEQLAYVPTLFQWSQKLPWILGVLGVIAGAGLVYLSEDRIKGLKKIAIILLVNGVLLLIGMWLATFVLNSIRFDGGVDDRMREALVGVFRTLNAEFNRTLLIFAITYAVLGAGGLVGMRFIKLKHSSNDKLDMPEEKPGEHKKEDKPEPKTGSDKP